ncbi:MAG: TetR/AcrR family transcriptional regulator C-terminal domain-containing protein [Micrococcales bacterium]|nr:TetR/AcrR family transcriptional regulator C-terminal domain-containing protein [Micrococcales bacterium]
MKLTAERIVDAGMAAFAEVGYRGLSMRMVAERLDAQAGSLYYHVPSKAALLHLMADRVAQRAYAAGTVALDALPGGVSWQEQVEAQIITLRTSITKEPGGAVLLAESPTVLSPGALALMERLLQTLAGAGLARQHRVVAADTLLSHVTGYVLQEQAVSHAPDAAGAAAAAALADLGAGEAYLERFPATLDAAATHDDDAQFLASLRLICAGIATLISPGGSA